MHEQFFQSELYCLNASGCWSIEDQDLATFFQKFTKIKEVRLNQVEHITDASLYHLAMNCPDVEILDLEGCWRITEKGLKKVQIRLDKGSIETPLKHKLITFSISSLIRFGAVISWLVFPIHFNFPQSCFCSKKEKGNG